MLASRISYVGDLGWELYVPIEQGARLWDVLWEAGSPHGLTACGIGVYGTTGRLEKGYRAFGAELESEYNVVEAGMARPTVKEQDFVGKEAHLRHRDEEPAAILCTLTIDDHTSAAGVKRYPLGREPITLRDGDAARPTPRAAAPTSRAPAPAPSLGKYILMAYLPPEHAVEGSSELAVEYMNERFPVTVDVVGARADLRPREREDPAREDPRLRQARADDRRQDRPHRRRAGDRDAHLGFTISPHEECGVEEAVRLVEAHGGESVVLTLGPPEAEEQLRDAMAIGIDRAILLVTDGEEWDPQATAAAIVEAIRGRRGRDGPFDLIFFGNESADAGGFQVGIRVAHALGRPCATGLKGVVGRRRSRALRAGGGRRPRRLRRCRCRPSSGEGRAEPAALPVGARAGCGAQRKPVEASTPAPAEPRLEKLRLVVPEGEGKQAEVLGRGRRGRARRRRPARSEIGVAR